MLALAFFIINFLTENCRITSLLNLSSNCMIQTHFTLSQNDCQIPLNPAGRVNAQLHRSFSTASHKQQE